jgi:hypothetical protein
VSGAVKLQTASTTDTMWISSACCTDLRSGKLLTEVAVEGWLTRNIFVRQH